MHGSGECRVHVAAGERADLEEVARFVHLRRIRFQCGDRVRHRLQNLILHRHLLGCLLSVEASVSHNQRKHVAHKSCGFTGRHKYRPVVDDQANVAMPGHILCR